MARGAFLSSVDLPSEATIREGVATGSSRLFAARQGSSTSSGGARQRRARAYTFTGRDSKDGSSRDGKGESEVRKGFRTIMKMLSKAHIKGDASGALEVGAGAAGAAGAGASAGGDPLALTRQRTRG